MSDLGDLIDDMWGDADPEATSGGGCLVKSIGIAIFLGIIALMNYFMQKG